MSRPRTRTLRAMVAVVLSLALTFALLPVERVAAIAGGYYPVRISPDVPGSFATPVGIVRASSGDIYIADTSNSRVKRMSPAGVVLSVWGTRGAAAGQFKEPEGVAVLSTGRVVVADTGNNRLQLFEADGTYVDTWGGPGAGNAQFSAPCGLAVDASNNVYVADAGNGRIQKLSSAGAYLATIGSMGVGNGQLINPRGVAVDAAGNVYVADTNNRRIQKFSPLGVYVKQWGLVEVGLFTYSRYSTPYSLAIDSTGNLLVADAAGMKYNPDNPMSATYYVERCQITGTVAADWGKILSQWGTPGTAPGQFAGAWGVASRTGGGAYVTDGGNSRIQVLSSTGTADAVWSGKGSGPGELDSPQGLAVDAADNAYVADTGNDRIQIFDPSGAYVGAWGSTGSGAGSLDDPTDVAIDAGGNVWVVERANNRVQSFTPAGSPLSVVGAGQLNAPEGIALDVAGNIYVADTGGARVRKFSGVGVLQMTVTGVAPNLLYQPSDVALDAAGNIYVSDKQGGNVRVYNSTGGYLRTIGSPGSNPGEFSQPSGVTMAGSSLFVVDSGNDRVQRFTTGGTFETTFGSQGAGLGEMSSPWRAAIDSLGRLLVAERDNHRIQVWAYDGVAPVSSFTGFVTFGTYSTPVTMTISATDGASGVAQTYYRINAGAATPYVAPLVFDADGTYIVRYYSVDRIGNVEAEKQARVTIDMTGPAGTFVLAGGASHVATTTVSSALSFTDPQFVTDMRFNTGAGYGDWESYADTRTFTLGEGTHTVLAQVRDSLNNVSTHSDSVTVDLTPPSTVATDVPAGWTNAPVAVRLIATDGASGVTDTFYQVGSGAVQDYAAPFVVDAEGETIVSFRSIDAVGNAEETATATVRIDTIPPTGTMILAGGADYVSTATVSIDSDVPDAIQMRVDSGTGYGAWLPYLAARTVVLPEGARTIAVEYADRADNRLVVEENVHVDLSAPSTLMSGITEGWVNAPATVGLLADDAGVGTDRTFYRIGSAEATEYTGPFVLDAEGITEIAYWSVDQLGWVEQESTATLSLDRADPSSAATVIPDRWFSGPVTVTIEASDTVGASPDISGVQDIYYRLDEGDPQLYGGAFQVGTEGETVVWHWAVDEAGNIETAESVLVRVDTTPPTGSMAIANGQSMIATTTPTIDSVVPDALEMRIDSGSGYGEWITYAPQVRTLLVGPGDHTVSVEYRDRADNRLELSDSVHLDLAGPVTAVSGIPATWTSQPVTVTLTPEDADSTVAATYYRTDSGTGWSDTAQYGDPFTITAEGQTALEFWSVDALGNVETTRTATVRIDTIAPTGTMLVNLGATYSVDAELSISSEVSGASEMRVDYGDGYSAWSPYAETATTTVPHEGAFTIRVQYRDLALNTFELEGGILVDLTMPVTTIHGVPDPYSPVPVEITLEASDELSGVAHTYYRLDDSLPVTYTVPVQIAREGTTHVTFWSVDVAGNVESEGGADVVIDSVPAAPAAPSVVAFGRDWADLRWDFHPESDVTTYTVWRRTQGDELWARIADLDARDADDTGYAFHDTGLTSDFSYEYRLNVHDYVGNASTASATTSVTVSVEDERLSGQDRYQTSLAISSATFETADVAVLATGASFADALGASSLAGALHAPVLITPPDHLPAGLLGELTRLGVERVVIIGGEGAVSSGVANQLSGFTVERLAGGDRYETAAIVASETINVRAGSALPGTFFIVRGDSFPDALAASPVAYANCIPVLLVRTDGVPDATRDIIASVDAPEAVVLGGTGAVSEAVANDLNVPVTRVQGATRYATATAFATWAIEHELASARIAGLATGVAFPDALTGGAALGALHGTVVLTTPTTLSPATAEWLTANAGTLESVIVLGGGNAISDSVVDAVRAAIR